MKKHTLKPTKKQLEVMKLFWAMFQQEQNLFYTKVGELERNMSERVGIENLEFFLSEYGYYCGIGNYNRTISLVHAEELEKR